MDLWATKLLVIILAWIIIVSFALLPIKVSTFFLAQGQPGRKVMGVINCFGGGIFFGSYLLHMAPEVRMLLEISWLKPKNIVYPFPELFMGLGFFLVLYLEKIFKSVNDNNDDGETTKPVDDGDKETGAGSEAKGKKSVAKNLRCSCFQGEEEEVEVRGDGDADVGAKEVSTSKFQCLCIMCHRMSLRENQADVKAIKSGKTPSKSGSSIEEEIEVEEVEVEVKGDEIVPIEPPIEPADTSPVKSGILKKSDVSIEMATIEEKQADKMFSLIEEELPRPIFKHQRREVQGPTAQGTYSEGFGSVESTRSIILILSLSLHCLFEGMGCGLQVTEARVWNLFIVLAAHEWVVAFSIGLQLTKCYNTRKVFIGAILYSLMTPSGIAIGTAISESPGPVGHNALINGLLKAIAAGTFINVTFLEILKDKLSSDSSCAKIAALTLGYVLMALLSLIPIQDPDDDYAVNNRSSVVI